MFNKDWRYDIVDCGNNQVSIKTPYNAATYQYTSFEHTDDSYKIEINNAIYIFKPHPDYPSSWAYVGFEGEDPKEMML